MNSNNNSERLRNSQKKLSELKLKSLKLDQNHPLLSKVDHHNKLNGIKKKSQKLFIPLTAIILIQLFLPLIISSSNNNYDILPTYAVVIAITMPLLQIFLTKIYQDNEMQKIEMYFEILLYKLTQKQTSPDVYDDAIDMLHGLSIENTSSERDKISIKKLLKKEIEHLEHEIKSLENQSKI